MSDIEKEAIKYVNELFGTDQNLDRLPQIKRLVEENLKECEGRISEQQSALDRAVEAKRQSYGELERRNSLLIESVKELISEAESLKNEINQFMNPILKLHEEKMRVQREITIMEQRRAFSEELNLLEEHLIFIAEAEDEEEGEGKQLGEVLKRWKSIPLILLASMQLSRCCSESNILSTKLDSLIAQCQKHVFAEFKKRLPGPKKEIKIEEAILLGHVCLVADVIGDEVRERLINSFCDSQLKDYREVFKQNKELATLEGIPKRFGWFKKILRSLQDEKYSIIFPSKWKVNEMQCIKFCQYSAEDLSLVVWEESTIDEKTLAPEKYKEIAKVIMETMEFESFLTNQFSSLKRTSINCLLKSFTPWVPVLVKYYGNKLAEYLDKMPERKRDVSIPMLKIHIRDFFTELDSIIRQIYSLIQDEVLLQMLISMFRESFKGLFAHMSKFCSGKKGVKGKYGGGNEAKKWINAIGVPFSSSSDINYKEEISFQISLLEMSNIIDRNSKDITETLKVYFLPSISSAADIIDDVFDLQELLILKSRILNQIKSGVSAMLQPIWTMFKSMEWKSITSCGDRSNYVQKMQRILIDLSPLLRPLLESDEYLTFWNDLTADIFAEFSKKVHDLKVVLSEGAIQQLLVDLDSMRRVYGDLFRGHSIRSEYNKKILIQSGEIEMYLKCLLLPIVPSDSFVQGYLLIRPDPEEANFIAFLAKKGIKDSTPYIEQFRQRLPQKPSEMSLTKEQKRSTIDEHLSRFLTTLKLQPNNKSPK